MANSGRKILEIHSARPRMHGVKVGWVERLMSGTILVDFPGNPYGPAACGWGASVDVGALTPGVPVLLAFEEDDPRRPIVIDRIESNPRHSSARRPAPEAPVRAREQAGGGACAARLELGEVIEVRDGAVYVSIAGESGQALRASTTFPLRNLADPVLLFWPSAGDPVILGQICRVASVESPEQGDLDLTLRGRRIRIEADESFVVVAGRTRLHLDGRGRVTTSGDQVVSRARQTNRVKGGNVQIN